MNEQILNLRINGSRLWDMLMEMAEIGATAKGGCNRQALTDEDKSGRDLFMRWCEEVGCTFRVDEVGNIFARREGRNPELPPILVGSHLDTQPTGGKFDGVYGVLAGVEVLRTLDDQSIDTEYPIEVAVWMNEEGARFAPAVMGSGVWSGALDKEEVYKATDKAGITVKDELARLNYLGNSPAKAGPIRAAFEVHIEQGPILEAEKKQIGVVTGVQGVRWYNLVIEGVPCHAGPSPMEGRKDPFMGLLPIVQHCYELAAQHGPWARATIGDIKAEPGSRNTVPERLIVNVDLRHPDADVLAAMDKAFRNNVAYEAKLRGLVGEVEEIWHMPVTAFAPMCIDAVKQSVEHLGYSHMEMVSGAGHDSVYIATVAPTSMIFIPCENGLSHNEAENAAPQDIEAGANLLLQSILKLAF